MKIEKFKKDKGNTYKVYFDDNTIISLYDDVIVKYNLLVNKEMSVSKFDEITEYNDFLNGYYKSIKYINKKLRSELEIEEYLKKINTSNSDIKSIIKKLYNDGYLNKDNYMKAYINDKYNLSNYGSEKVEKDLIKLGYNVDEINDYLLSLDWNSKLEKIINKRIKVNHNLSNNSLKIKLTHDLINLGFRKSDIINVLDNIEFNDDYDILKKEYNRVLSKYKKKYNDKELEIRINKYLYSKGFNINDINRVKYEDEV